MSQNAPRGLRTAGRRLWREVTGSYELDEHEAVLLREACRLSDRLDQLDATVTAEGTVLKTERGPVVHPAAVEARMTTIALTRTLASLRLPSGEEEGRPQRRGAARGAYGIRGSVPG